MIHKLIQKLMGDPHKREAKRLMPIVQDINRLEEQFQKELTDSDLAEKTSELKMNVAQEVERLADDLDEKARAKAEQEILNNILPEAFALVKNACRRLVGKTWKVRGNDMTWDMVPYDVQVLGGIVLHEGKIAEMKTGEGKTLVCTMPLYLNALMGRGVHLVTVNEYLAQRDAEWMGEVYKLLGLTVGIVTHGQIPAEKKEAYTCDIIYGTNNEFGFDYLRDNMAVSMDHIVQRHLWYAIVDEVDSILVDEARTPLIISMPAQESTAKYAQHAKLVAQLHLGTDFIVDEKIKTASLTEEGIAKMEKMLGMENIYTEAGFQEVHHLEQALKARACYKKDVDYVVKDDEVVIVDEFTGRIMPGRRFSEGLHQAIEAKEGVEVQRESKTLATVSFQNFFRLYTKLGGMTGTAETEEEEFRKIYGLDVVVIPTNKPCVRNDHGDLIYKNTAGKFTAVVEQIKELHAKGQPVLVGTISVEKSEMLSKLLQLEGIPHNVLNAKQHEREAEIIVKAGEKGSVTIATNMAGRGTDIKLGAGVQEVGGLFVLGTERHESRRIDNQLRGRSGRQGDPGTSLFYVSMEDDLMRLFGSDRIKKMMETLGLPDNVPIEHALISRSIESAQKRVEGHNFDIRKHLVEYDDVMNKQREIMYARRRKVLKSANIKNEIVLLIEREVESIINAHTTDADTANWDYRAVWNAIRAIHRDPIEPIALQNLEKIQDQQQLIDYLRHYLFQEYQKREEALADPSILRHVEQSVYLRAIDTLWMEHIDNMTHLREAIGLQGYAHRDPLIEYKQEGYDLFTKLLADIQTNTVNTIFKVDIAREIAQKMAVEFSDDDLQTNAEQIEGVLGGDNNLKKSAAQNPLIIRVGDRTVTQAPIVKKAAAHRNDPCPCQSGKKFKKCCGKN